MFDILIVDDEYYICEGIRRQLEHLALPDIGMVRVCLRGEEALELCNEYKPQIVITDIKMGGMDGIELIRRLGKRLYPVQFLVLSGYDDFTYVKEAFKNGAVDYLLKPLLASSLKEVLERVCENLRHTIPAPKESRAGRFHVSREILGSIVSLPFNETLPDTLIAQLGESGITAQCRIALLASNKLLSQDHENQYINAIYDQLESKGALLCHAVTESKLCILAEEPLHQPLIFFLRDWCELRSGFVASISTCGEREQAPALYATAENYLLRRMKEGYGKIFFDDGDVSENIISSRLKHLITQFIQTPSLITLETMKIRFSGELNKLSLPALKTFFTYFNQMLDWSIAKKEIMGERNHFPLISDFRNFQELEEFLFARLAEYATQSDATVKNASVAIAAKEYIEAHFTEKLTLMELSDRFFVSYSHLSKLFQKTYHMKYIEYVYMLRMEYALELLKGSILTIQQIAMKTGYDNLFNFSRAFKTYYGVAPSYYRKSITKSAASKDSAADV